MRERCSVAFEAVSLLSSRWVEVRAYPTPQGLAVNFRDITDRKRAEDQLREADRRKSEFLAVLAHELRNPLAPLRNGLYSLKLRSDNDPMVSQTVSMMDRQLTHLVRLVDDLLDVSRITSGKLELRRQKVLLTEVLGTAVEASRAFIEAHQHELVLDLQVQSLWVDGDPDRLAQVFSNLLFNSAKYTEPRGRITLTLERENDETVITVQDNGIGIPPSAFEEVFDMFSQVRSHEALAMDGLGIGLSLVRTLVQRHGGSVLVFSEGLGKGSRFTVRLPIVEEPVATLDEAPPPPPTLQASACWSLTTTPMPPRRLRCCSRWRTARYARQPTVRRPSRRSRPLNRNSFSWISPCRGLMEWQRRSVSALCRNARAYASSR